MVVFIIPACFTCSDNTAAVRKSTVFLFHFFLTQAKIPHRRILKFDPDRNTVWIEKELPEEFRSAASGAELCQRLKYNFILCSEDDCGAGYLHDIGNVINRVDHSQSGAVMAFRILDRRRLVPQQCCLV